MNTQGLCEISRASLSASGWFPGRSVDLRPVESVFDELGLVFYDWARDFLSEFNGLSVSIAHPRVEEQAMLELNAVAAAAGMGEQVSDYEGDLRRALVPIGETYGHYILLMDMMGATYGVFDGTILRFGANVIESLNTLCEGREPVVVKSE